MGAQTDQCVNATVRGALERGLGVTVVADGHSTWNEGGETATEIIARHNREFAQAGAHVADTATLTARKASGGSGRSYHFERRGGDGLQLVQVVVVPARAVAPVKYESEPLSATNMP